MRPRTQAASRRLCCSPPPTPTPLTPHPLSRTPQALRFQAASLPASAAPASAPPPSASLAAAARESRLVLVSNPLHPASPPSLLELAVEAALRQAADGSATKAAVSRGQG